MFLIADNISLLPCSCSLIAAVKTSLIDFTCSANSKIKLNFSSTILDDEDNVSISPVKDLSVAVIVFPCMAESSDSLRISSATTANPFPASPA